MKTNKTIIEQNPTESMKKVMIKWMQGEWIKLVEIV
jgi:hypothetical protein